MKCLFLCCLCACQFCTAKSLRVIEWIDFFSDQGVQIFYSSDYLTEQKKYGVLTLDVFTIPAFNLALKSQSLMLETIDKENYVVMPNQEISPISSGLLIKLIDSVTEKNIKDFQVYFQDKSFTAINGVVLINTMDAKPIQIKTLAKGYYSTQQQLDSPINQYKSVTLKLKSMPLNLDGIVVTASKINFRNTSSSSNTFARTDLENSINMGADPVRSAQSIAANTSIGISAKSRTRGGNDNESLIVLDNHVLRNPYHFKNFFSLFSTINLSVVDNIDFYSGVFPMNFGGKLSSVMDIKSGDNLNQSTHELGIDLFNLYYTYRLSNQDYSKQFQASIRSGGYLINKKIVRDSIIQPEFDDGYIKYTQQISPSWQASQHLLFSRDEISIDDRESAKDTLSTIGELADANTIDHNLWLQWHYDNEQNNSATIQVYGSRKHDARNGLLNNNETIASLSEDILTRYMGLKFNQNFNYSPRLSFSYGLEIYSESTEIYSQRNISHFGELVALLGLQSQQKNIFALDQSGHAANAFVNGRYQYSDKLIFDLGFRIEDKQWINDKIRSPRLNMSYFYDDKTTYRFALGRHQQSQHIDELLLEDKNPSYFKPSSADVAVFEFIRELKPNLNLKAEAYAKKYSSTQPYYENLFNGFHVLPDLFFDRSRITPDDSSANGIEISLDGKRQQMNWSVSYVFSDVDDEINTIETARSWDQHNALKLNLHVPVMLFRSQWQLNLGANYHNGWPKTDIIQTDSGLQIGARNTDTFKDFYQFDINLLKQHKTTKGEMFFSIQVNNLLNTENVCCINYQIQENNLVSEKKSWLPLVPNLSFVYKWQ